MRMRMRTVAGAVAGAVVGATAGLALAAPAHATGGQVDTGSTCEAYEVTITSPANSGRTWQVAATVAGADWLWPAGDLAPDGDAPDNGWVGEGASHTVAVPAGATGVTVAWWHGAGDPDLAADGWQTSLAEGQWSHPGGEACGLPEVEVLAADCDTVEIEFANPTEWYFSGDYRVDGEDGQADEWSDDEVSEGPHAGGQFGHRFESVDLPAGTSHTVEIEFDADSGEHTVGTVIRRGGEQRWYVPWQEVTVDCGTPDPSPSPSTSPDPSPSTSPGGSGGSDDEQLPQTGTPVPMAAGAGASLLLAGSLLVWVGSRRRRAAAART